ncbi:MAG: hypothetical protein V3T61_10345, partial [Acidobacteriota bacterium]
MVYQPEFRPLTILLLAVSGICSAFSQDVSTSFEFTSGQFTLGTSPTSVTFSGGQATTVGQPGLYRTGSNAWFIDQGQTGSITFETPAAQLELFFKNQNLLVQSELTLFDANNKVIVTFEGSSNGPDGMGFTGVQLTDTAVKTITLKNNVKDDPGVPDDPYLEVFPLASPYTVIDDFSFTAQQLTETLFLTHFGSGGGLQSDVVVFNPSSTASANGEVNFFDQNGTPLDSSGFLPGGNSFILAPLGSATLSTTGAGSTVITGSATVASDTPISAVIRFDITGVGVAGVEASQVLTSAIAPVRRTGTLSSGVAIRNTGTSTIQVTLELKDESGNVVEGGIPENPTTLAGNGQIAAFIEQFFSNAQTTTFTGTICVTAQSGQISVIALELDPANNVFTTLPV